MKVLVTALKEIYLKKYDSKEFEITYSSAVKRLFKEGMIKKEEISEKKSLYLLTDKGYGFANHILSYVSLDNRTKVIDQIRMQIMFSQYY